MFSFIKFIQSILSKLKGNKGIWFTVLTVSSVLGVLISISLMNMMSSDVAKKTYMQVHKVDTIQLQNILDNRYDSLLSIAGVVSVHPDILANIKTKSDTSINDILLNTEKSINKRVHSEPISVRYYASDYEATKSENFKYADLAMETKTSITGMVINKTGLRIIAITPVEDGNTTLGAIEISQDIVVVKNDFEKLGKEFSFILDKAQLVFIALGAKQGNLQDIGEKYKIFFHKYDPQFFTNIRNIDLELIQREKFHVNAKYFTTVDEAVDIDGKIVGLFVLGENSTNANSFVNITQNLISSVTTVALGLVISLILFMF